MKTAALMAPRAHGAKRSFLVSVTPSFLRSLRNTALGAALFLHSTFLNSVALAAASAVPPGCLPAVLEGADGEQYRLDQFKGRSVLLHFFSTRCMSCRPEMDALEEVHRYLGEDRPFEIVAVSSVDELPALQSFVRDHRITFPVVLDRSKTLQSCYKVKELPVTFALDRDGAPAALRHPESGKPAKRLDGPIGWNSRKGIETLEAFIDTGPSD